MEKHLLKPSAQEVKAFKQWCRTALACEADAQQALATFAQGLQATLVAQSTVRPIPRYATRGRPRPDTPPEHVVYQLDGALAMRSAARQARIDQHSGFSRATHELDDTLLPPQELLAGYKGQVQAERGFRFLKAP